MTRTVTRSLGQSPLTGKQALDQAARFKAQLCSLQTKPESVTLLTVMDTAKPIASVSAVFDADDPCAAEWVEQAEELSQELWQILHERRKGVKAR